MQPSELSQPVAASYREKDGVPRDYAPVALAASGHSAAEAFHRIGESAYFLIR